MSTLGLLVSKGFLEYTIFQPRAQLENSAFKKPLLPVVTFCCLQLPVVTCSQLYPLFYVDTNSYLQLPTVTCSQNQLPVAIFSNLQSLQLPTVICPVTCKYLQLLIVTYCYLQLSAITYGYPQLPIDILPLLPVVTLSLLLPICYHCITNNIELNLLHGISF